MTAGTLDISALASAQLAVLAHGYTKERRSRIWTPRRGTDLRAVRDQSPQCESKSGRTVAKHTTVAASRFGEQRASVGSAPPCCRFEGASNENQDAADVFVRHQLGRKQGARRPSGCEQKPCIPAAIRAQWASASCPILTANSSTATNK
jgi:hypothetical protein